MSPDEVKSLGILGKAWRVLPFLLTMLLVLPGRTSGGGGGKGNLDEWSNLSEALDGGRTAILAYAMAEDRPLLFLVTASTRGRAPVVRAIPLEATARDLAPRIAELRRLVTERRPDYQAEARRLYDLLIHPAAAELRGPGTLCIVPDGILWEVPFQALLSPAGRHLLEDYAIYYAPSLATLREIKRRASSRRDSPTLLALGNPSPSGGLLARLRETRRGERFAPLPEAELEVRLIAGLYGADRSRTLLREEASEQAFKTLARGRQTLHFATHGVLDNRHPLFSYLLLADPEDQPGEDGVLEAREILQLRLDADLAVLSACETARGKVGAGEGVIGMTWAFLMAGCRTVVVSQWKVDSVKTAELMVEFFQFLKSGNKAQALRQSALRMVGDPRTRHPYYWAGFIVAGSDR